MTPTPSILFAFTPAGKRRVGGAAGGVTKH